MKKSSFLLLVFLTSSVFAEPQMLTLALNQQDSQRLLQYYRVKATEGDAHAQFKVGFAYEIGDGLPEDQKKAGRWYEKAARQGHKNAILNLAAMDGTDKLFVDSESEYQNTLRFNAEAGDIEARNQLARMLINNVLIRPNRNNIFNWIEELAIAKNQDSQFILAQMYEIGFPVPQNFVMAYAWYSVAAATGDEFALFNRDAIARRMSAQQLEQGQDRSMQLYENML